MDAEDFARSGKRRLEAEGTVGAKTDKNVLGRRGMVIGVLCLSEGKITACKGIKVCKSPVVKVSE